jgi:hypothetical protein
MIRSLLPRMTPLALLLIVLPAVAGGTVRYVNPDGVCGGHSPCYADLQSAIDASIGGDLIEVQAAVYLPSATVLVNKPVAIYGPQAGVTPLPSKGTTRIPGSSAEAVFDGGGSLATILQVLADDVSINGIEVRNGTGDMISSPAGLPIRNTAIRNCIIHDSSGDEGVQLRTVAGAVIECNYVYATVGDGLNLCCGSTGGIIRFNECRNIASENAAIYVYQATNTLIEGNLVDGTTINEGIKLGSKDGSDAGLAGGAIVNNTTRNTAQDGIAVYMSGTVVSCNDVSASTSENGAVYVAWAVSHVSVVDNHIHDNVLDTDKWGNPAGITIGVDADPANITVSGNRLVNNLPNGITNLASSAVVLVAEDNWWGAADGPGPVGPGSGDQVSINVDYAPWLAAAPSPVCPVVGTCPGEGPVPVSAKTWGAVKARYR